MPLLICSLRKKGAASYVLKESPKAIVTHSCSHNLNLSLASSCTNPEIDNVLKTNRAITIFFNSSPNREDLLDHIVKSRCIEAEKRKVLVDNSLVWAWRILWTLLSCNTLHGWSLWDNEVNHPKNNYFDSVYKDCWGSKTKKEATSYLKVDSRVRWPDSF